MDKIMDKIITEELILRQLSKETSLSEINRLDLKKRLRKATKTAWTKGAGLAAIQIGIPLRFAVLWIPEGEQILLNPEIIELKGEYIYKEGCLSIPGKQTRVKRFRYVKYRNNGKIREAINFKAALIQHEIDHMNGILNIDKKAKIYEL